MKKQVLTSVLIFNFTALIAQTSSQGSPPSNNTNARATAAWYRGGNLLGGTNPPGANIFGTLWNSPIYTQTAGITRTRLSGNLPAVPALGTTVNLTGHFGIGLNGYFNNPNNAPLTMLHLEGSNNTPYTNHFGGQYRTWMRVGTFMRENSDAMYVGLKPEGYNRSDAVVNWSDDGGADKLRFIFTSTLLNLPGGINPLNPSSQNGYEFMRMHASGPLNQSGANAGYVGIGPLFSDMLPPQNRLHINAESGLPTYTQITNVQGGGRTGTGQNATDGLKIGTEQLPSNNYQTGFLQWQENTPFIVQTEYDNFPGGIQTGERMRITSVGSLNNTQGNFGGIMAPANRTRVAISADGSQPITRPRSLLHLGYNTSSTIFGTNQDGYRSWMDVGMFIGYNSDNMYIGLKEEGNDRKDAVINWGDNQVSGNIQNNGPDHLRFIFTSTTSALSGQGDPVSQSQNGLETMRIVPFKDTTYYLYDTTGVINDSITTYGRVGIGDFTITGVNQEPTHKLDVVGNGRFRYLPDSLYYADSTVYKYVMVDSLGVLRWSSSGPFGAPCADTVGDKFHDNRHVDLNDYNFYFTRNVDTSFNNNVGFGWDCGTILKAKVDVIQKGISGIGGSFIAQSLNSGIGVRGFSHQTGTDTTQVHVGVLGSTSTPSGTTSIGILGNSSGLSNSWAGVFNGDVMAGSTYIPSDSTLKTNIQELTGGLKLISLLKPKTFYLDGQNNPEFNFSTKKQFGFISQEVAQNFPSLVKQVPYSVKVDSLADVSLINKNFVALNYMGIIPINTQAIIELNEKVDKKDLSDASIKTNVQDLTQSLDKVLEMRGISYDWNHNVHPELNLDSNNHVGFLAQELQQVDNRLTYLAEDSLLHVKYEKVVPILAEAIQELNDKVVVRDSIIDTLQAQVQDLNNRLTQLENCLSNILPFLCQLNQSAIQANTPQAQEEVRKSLQVTLSNKTTIILDQNVPNPFAEQTSIRFSIPESVKKAQIHFYDNNGRLMQSVDVVERGVGSITVFGADLSAGTYSYTLVADGVVVATKKMMKE